MTSLFRRLESIPHDDPNMNEQRWFEIQPCRRFQYGDKFIVITQPSSTFWVYLLGLLTILAGVYFFVTQDGQLSRYFWGWSLLLWGVGALVAGTSYQALGFQFKCQGRTQPIWTNWWEVIYLMLQQISMNLMLVAVAFSTLSGGLLDASINVAIALSVVYVLVTLYGAFKPLKSLITFEFMVQVSTPIVVFFIGLNGWRYLQTGQMLDLTLLGCWFGLVITMLAYWVYYKMGITNKLWSKGRWFSENDVLHVLLIAWVIYIPLCMGPYIQDL
ncbi:hypothetical protein [Marinomonas epiphytica]